MKTALALIFAGSLLALLFILIRQRMTRAWFVRFGLHMALAALVIYGLNELGWIGGVHIPLNPTTIAAVTVLGVPGIMLIAGLQTVLL